MDSAKQSPASASAHARLVLAFNAGSSSIKLALFTIDGAREVARGSLDLQRSPLELVLSHGGRRETVLLDAPITDSMQEVVQALLAALESHDALGALAAAAHRVVHGGRRFARPVMLDAPTLDEIDALTPLAPLHQPRSVRLMRAVRAMRPGLRQTASFDTAFHATQDALLRRFALPRQLHDEGVLRYGFHGLSYAWIARTLQRDEPAVAAGRVVALHLGHGASLCAMHGGRSVDSSMGFSTLDGVPMGTRCGALDPGVLLYLLKERRTSLEEVEDMLYHRSGLLGVSGLSGDLRELKAAADGNEHAAQALALFAARCAGEVGRLAASLQGLDGLVFTAGIGEHDAGMRAAIAARLGWLGVLLDRSSNERHARRIDAAGSRIAVFVIPADEEQVIATDAIRLLDEPA